jgi:hypothetical protein
MIGNVQLMKNLLSAIGFKVLELVFKRKLYTASKAFQNGKYSEILQVYHTPYSGFRRSTVYENYFRIICLIKMRDRNWKSEYLAMEQINQLNSLGPADERYLKKIIVNFLNDEGMDDLKDLAFYDVDISKVSKLTLRLFPLRELTQG